LLRLPEVIPAETVWVVEGEQCVDALRSIDLPGTTCAGGAKAVGKTDWTPLAGKTVIIMPDHDAAGEAYANDVAVILAAMQPRPSIRVVRLAGPNDPPGFDIADWVEAHGDAAEPDAMRAEIEALAAAAPEWTPPATSAPATAPTATAPTTPQVAPPALQPGTVVMARDGGYSNFGRVVSDNGATISVEFVSKEGQRATVDIARRDLFAQDGRSLAATPTESGPPRFVTSLLTSAQFADATYSQCYLVKGILAAGQPAVGGGRSKTLKTTIIGVDLAVSLGSGTRFLNHFPAEHVNVGFWSGESGEKTIHETAHRIAKSKGVALRECSVNWSFDLPRLFMPEHIEALAAVITEKKLDVAIVDPLYLTMLSPQTAGMASNLFSMGAALLPLSEVAQSTGCTLVLLHHFRKASQAEPDEPAGLEELSMSGAAEWARQWLLLQRRDAYQHDGRHSLWLRAGGSAGHAGLYGVEIDEGTIESGRHWSVQVETVGDVRVQVQREREGRKAKDLERRDGEHVDRLVVALQRFPRGETERTLRIAARLNPDNFGRALLALRQLGRIDEIDVVKGRSKYPGYKLK
jgi:hypothetical protein